MRRGRPRHDDVLTPREWEVLDLLREGLTNEQIATRLGVSLDTAKFHVSEILGKLGVESRQEAAAWTGRPRAAWGVAPLAWVLQKLGSVSPWKAAGAGVIGAAGVALVLLTLGVLMNGNEETLGKIAFVRDGNIWVQELPNGTPVQLTQDGAASGPQWSPSGEWLLYRVRDKDADQPPGLQLWLVRSDGSGIRRLSDNGYSGYWLPEEDDRVLYYTSDDKAVVEGADGAQQTTIYEAFVDGHVRVVMFPLMPSRDGSKHIFLESRTSISGTPREAQSVENLYGVANSDGTDQHPLIGYMLGEREPIVPLGWSSDGTHVLFAFLPEEPHVAAAFYAVPTAGGEPKALDLSGPLGTFDNSSDLGAVLVAGDGIASWSGRRLAVIWPDGSGYSFITGPDVAANAPAWSPDGHQIAYVAAPDFGIDGRDRALAMRRVWLSNPDGSNQRQVTFGENFRDSSPMWSANGRYLLFARTSVEDFCDTGSYDLMRYTMEDGGVDLLADDLPLLSTYNELVAVGRTPTCPTDFENTITDTLGSLNLGPVLDWWQPDQ